MLYNMICITWVNGPMVPLLCIMNYKRHADMRMCAHTRKHTHAFIKLPLQQITTWGWCWTIKL
jgi:hypothetical protein